MFLIFSLDIASDRFDPLQMSSKSYNFSIFSFSVSSFFLFFYFYFYLFIMFPPTSFHYISFSLQPIFFGDNDYNFFAQLDVVFFPHRTVKGKKINAAHFLQDSSATSALSDQSFRFPLVILVNQNSVAKTLYRYNASIRYYNVTRFLCLVSHIMCQFLRKQQMFNCKKEKESKIVICLIIISQIQNVIKKTLSHIQRYKRK